jgi:hypothetical protein
MNNENNNQYAHELISRAELIVSQFNANGYADYDEVAHVLYELTHAPEMNDISDNNHAIEDLTHRVDDIFALLEEGQIPQLTQFMNRGSLFVPKNATNSITFNTITFGNQMVDFQGEKNRGRYYKKSTYNNLPLSVMGQKTNPFTRVPIEKQNVYMYTATFEDNNSPAIFTGAGKRRKTRKAKKTRKNRKH